MNWLSKITSGFGGGASIPLDTAGVQRRAEWAAALESGRLPSFVEARLAAAGSGKTPWISTMTTAELGLARSKGIRPIAMVSGTCWYHYGYSWTNGHPEGWHAALARMGMEAAAAGANAVVDVKMRTIRLAIGESMDFTVLGTAVRIDGLPASPETVVATVPAIAFVRLLEAGIVPTGIAIGGRYHWLQPGTETAARALERKGMPFANAPLTELGQFWERIRREALQGLYEDTQRLGNGVLAHTHFGQLLKFEGDDNTPTRFLGRHIVIGTAVDSRDSSANKVHDIRTVVDMRDELSPLRSAAPHGHNAYPAGDEEGAI